jgi:integrase/recombinase XerD
VPPRFRCLIDPTPRSKPVHHESITTTQIYQHADPALKEAAIARIAPPGTKPGRYRPTDQLLAFLEAL